MNNCYLSGSSNGHQQQQQQSQYQKPLSISANNFSPASNSSISDNNKTLYKSSSHNINTGGNCDKNYQQQATQQQQLYGNSSKNGNSASYLSQSTPSTHFDFEHMFSDPIDLQHNPSSHNLNKTQSYNTTASGSSRSSRSYQTNQPAVNSDQFQGSCDDYLNEWKIHISLLYSSFHLKFVFPFFFFDRLLSCRTSPPNIF